MNDISNENLISDGLLDSLTSELGIGERAVYGFPGPLDLASLGHRRPQSA